MSDTILKPTVIEEVDFPEIGQSTTTTTGSGNTAEVLTPNAEVGKSFPPALIARTVIADSFDTQSRRILSDYTFGEYGSISIGKFEPGVSGDVKISPAGIITRNKAGETTITIDATTGDATFKGTVAAGSLIAGNYFTVQHNGNYKGIFINDGTYDVIFIGTEET